MKGFAFAGPLFAGDPNQHEDKSDGAFVIVAPNLTPDPATGIMASWSEEQFVAEPPEPDFDVEGMFASP